jgi:formate-dependent nitrite reductase membrane component NrfD
MPSFRLYPERYYTHADTDTRTRTYPPLEHVLAHGRRPSRRALRSEQAKLLKYAVVKTPRSVYAALPGRNKFRPSQETPISNFVLAGDFTYALFTIGIMGIGFMAVPILAGSASYALAEAFGRKASLSYTYREAPTFYMVIALSTIVGMALNFVGIKPFQMLYYAAALNGIIAPPLMAMITHVGNNPRVMGEHVNKRYANTMGWAITAIMGLCAVALIAALIAQ